MPSVRLLILDVDNTLFDWFGFWMPSFSSMLDAVVAAARLDRDTLLDEIQAVHKKHGTSEYAFVLQETASIRRLPAELRARTIEAGRLAFSNARKRHSRLYPGIVETLEVIRSNGTSVVAFTESQLFYSTQRLRRFGLDGLIDALYCANDHAIPDSVELDVLRTMPADSYRLERTGTIILPEGVRKPDVSILRRILLDCSCDPSEAAYVGDSLYKDVLMAQQAHVHDVFAEYGSVRKQADYALLKRVSHWTEQQVCVETESAKEVFPSIILRNKFSEILDHLTFKANDTAGRSLKTDGI